MAAYGGIILLSIFLYFYGYLLVVGYRIYTCSIDKLNQISGYHLLLLMIISIPANIAADSLSILLTWFNVFFLLILAASKNRLDPISGYAITLKSEGATCKKI